jgi:hypothetical protein
MSTTTEIASLRNALHLAESAAAAALNERDVLARWKKEALVFMRRWEAVDEAVREHPDTLVGHNVSDTALRFIRERDEAREELENWKASGIHSCHADCKRPLCAANRKIRDMREAIKVSLIRAYTAGYQHGHEATVEGGFIPVHHSDETEFHAENIHQMLCDGSLPEIQPHLPAKL